MVEIQPCPWYSSNMKSETEDGSVDFSMFESDPVFHERLEQSREDTLKAMEAIEQEPVRCWSLFCSKTILKGEAVQAEGSTMLTDHRFFCSKDCVHRWEEHMQDVSEDFSADYE